ncbi:MAG: hypothetical protein Q7V14_00565 [Coriobacteriia bacterium]|nr:hypothetical protein [Coriobacteriia bacterium]
MSIIKRQDWFVLACVQSTRRELIEVFGGWLSGFSGVVTSSTKPAGDRRTKRWCTGYLTL